MTHRQPSSPPSAVRRSFVLAVLGATALAVGSGTALAQTTGGGTTGAPTGPAPFARGTLGAVSGSTLQVQGRNGNTSVVVNNSTSYLQTEAATISDVKNGTCIRAVGTGSDADGITATTVALSEPQGKKGCTQGNPLAGNRRTGPGANGQAGGGRVFNGPGGTLPNGQTSPNGQTPPTLPDGAARPSFGAAFGTVKSVSGDTITVKAQIPRQPAQNTTPTTTPANTKSSTKPAKATTQTVVVTVDANTAWTQTVSATQKDLAVGSCVTATGSVDSVGTVTAKEVTISQPENGSCTGFGGFGGAFGPGGFGRRFGQDGGNAPGGSTGNGGTNGSVT
jgi:hypothetical protein